MYLFTGRTSLVKRYCEPGLGTSNGAHAHFEVGLGYAMPWLTRLLMKTPMNLRWSAE